MTKEQDLLIEFDELGFEPTTLVPSITDTVYDFRDKLKRVITDLQAIKDAKPSEALQNLYDLRDYLLRDRVNIYNTSYYIIVERALLKAQEQEKVLKILFGTKNIKIGFYDNGKGRTYYIEFDKTRTQKISQEEFDLVKRWLEK